MLTNSINTSQSIKPFDYQFDIHSILNWHECLSSVPGFDTSHAEMDAALEQLRNNNADLGGETHDHGPNPIACGYLKDLRTSIDNEMTFATGATSAASSVPLSFSLPACKQVTAHIPHIAPKERSPKTKPHNTQHT